MIATDPTTARVILPEPHDKQWAIINGANKRNAVECGRRFGKTKLGGLLAALPAIKGQPVGWFAPNYKIMLGAWQDICGYLAPAITYKGKTDMRLELVGGGEIEFWSLHNNENAGRSRKYARVICDEASLVRNFEVIWQNSIRPTLTDLRGDAWFLFTPKGHNYAHRLYQKGKTEDIWSSWRFGTIDNPYIDPEEIEEARRELPERVFNQEYLGIPADDGGNPFGLQHIALCVGPISTDKPVAFGVDLAKSQDWVVVVGLDRAGRVCVFDRWQHIPWRETEDRIFELVGYTPTKMDSTGVGDPIVEGMARDRPSISGYKFKTGPEGKQKLMEGLMRAIQSHSIRFPDNEIRHELEVFEYELRPGGGVRYSAASGMHDDCVCALALALEQARVCSPAEAALVHHGESKMEGGPDEGENLSQYYDRKREDPNFGFPARRTRRW